MMRNAIGIAVGSLLVTATWANAGSPGGSPGTAYRIEEHEASGKKIVYVPREDFVARRVVIAPPPDEAPPYEAMALDFLISRPLSIVSYALGTVFFVGSLPFAAASGDVHTPAQRLVVEPGNYAFRRRLGEFE